MSKDDLSETIERALHQTKYAANTTVSNMSNFELTRNIRLLAHCMSVALTECKNLRAELENVKEEQKND